MNGHERRRKRDIGVAFLAEAIADVLAEARDSGKEEGIWADYVRHRLGFDVGMRANELCRGVLHQMLQHGEVEVDRTSGYEHWRLVTKDANSDTAGMR